MTDTQSTHWEGCCRDHHDCAIEMVERLERELAEAHEVVQIRDAEIDRLERELAEARAEVVLVADKRRAEVARVADRWKVSWDLQVRKRGDAEAERDRLRAALDAVERNLTAVGPTMQQALQYIIDDAARTEEEK